MPALIFVYGTLKEGFPNFALNNGRRVGGRYRTRWAFPLYVVQLVNEERAPWLVNQPGQGHRVSGEVFEVEDVTLQAMDVLEEVGLPTGYARVEVELESLDTPGPVLRAQAYLKQADQLGDCLAREGPYDEYTPALAAGYWLTVDGGRAPSSHLRRSTSRRPAGMSFQPLRLPPGVDLRHALEALVSAHDAPLFVVAGIGSLVSARLRYAGEASEAEVAGPLEIVSLSGTVTVSGAHLHMAVSDAAGRVWGGHVGPGNVVRTTAEILLAPLPGWSMTRGWDAATGFDELVIRRCE